MYLIISNEAMQALCRGLLYSLLAGVAASVLAALVVHGLRKARAVYRYHLLLFIFMLLVGTAGFILINQLQQAGGAVPVTGGHAVPVTGGMAGSGTLAVHTGYNSNWLEVINNFCNRYASVIVMLWLVIIGIKTIRLAASFRATARLRYSQVQAAPVYWQQWLQGMQARLGIRRQVSLLQSVKTRVPLAFGFFKPVILLPAGVLSGLKPAEVEAILLHELAHIARKDYLVNILQTAAETLFFFNPAVLWISRLLRDEREHCCDDMALEVTGNRLDYVKALVSFQEYYLPAGALALSGSRGSLFNRAQRILLNKNKALSYMEKIILSAVIVAVCTIIFAFSMKKHGGIKKQPVAAGNTVVNDTLPETDNDPQKQNEVQLVLNGREYRLVENSNSSHTLFVNGRQVPANEMAQHQKIIDRLKKLLAEDADDAGPAPRPKTVRISLADIEDMPKTDGADDIPKGPFINVERFAKDLIEEKVIGSRDELKSYKFTYDELVVNGKKVPGDVHQRLRGKHQVAKGPGHYYNYAIDVQNQHF